MAYNPFGEDTGVEDFSGQQATDEERKKRLARLAGVITGQQSLGDAASQMIGERIAPISQAIENPQAALEQRFGQPVERAQQLGNLIQGQQPQGPVGPVMPQEVAQQRQEQLPVAQTQQAQQAMVAPVSPEQPVQQAVETQAPTAPQPVTPVNPAVQEVTQTQLPQAGEPTQVAGPTQIQGNVPAQATVNKEAVNDIHHQAFIDASNSTDPKVRSTAFAQLMANPNVPEGLRNQAQQAIVIDFQNQRGFQKANEEIKNMGPNDYARALQSKDKEGGSYLKAILFHRLGLNELAQQEQEKISPTLKAESMLVGDQRYTAYRNKAGEITKAYDSAGKEVSQDEVARLAAEQPMSKSAMFTGGSKIYSIPKGNENEGQEYTARFNTHTGKYENIITTGPNAGKQYTGAPGLEKRVETNEAITANKTEASKGLINYRLQQNLKFAGPLAYTRAGAGYVGKYNAENGTNLGYNNQGVLVDHNTSQPVVQNRDGSINATTRAPATTTPNVTPPAQGAAPAAPSANQVTSGVPDLTKPPPYNPAMSPRENQKAQDNWAAVQKKTRQDFTTGPQGKVVTAMNTAVAHLDTLNEAGTALYGGQIPVANKVVREFSNQMGLPEYTNFEGIKHIVGTEVAKAVSGSGQTALADRQAIEKEFDSANSPDQLKGIIKKYQELMGGQLKSQKQTWTGAGLHPDEFDSKLLPRTKKVINETEAPTRSKW